MNIYLVCMKYYFINLYLLYLFIMIGYSEVCVKDGTLVEATVI